ncbi:hypothetical protein COY59_00650 [Candidatus Gottesmanbacteria bacterium CG_4_10_14_0_8_um_filter_37_24]|uniref:PABS domain-containing protein n=2 Tax=Candidatus Gottesmaniibacteriota TaxID=1752720 RepID=A0A2M7RTC8_9BACT|nr:MAG: hypothetical protein AUJ73_03640 [Candidatus Gottesmanbacteria bacterium CG1_02_37_22]PIP32600.1 MAG: hypothetical protein COX23_03945 [Candidatus Gottesmanbacteria bacterium CG23_combo_of_CG06-09_8_20_14_all_37_19]PIZ03224.1 MAG: hypothetical protein COY59_00650 [Candidatus Gottesmanbacteria bacterium CG_4_10_14_0_8_um_filter_37_24]
MNIFSYLFPINIKTYFSKYNGRIEIKEYFGKKIIYVGDAQQTGGTITPMWGKVIGDYRRTKRKIRRCLVLGIGGGDVFKKISDYYPEAEVTAVDIDKVMVDTAYEFFSLGKVKNIQTIISDAIGWISNVSVRHQYDLIIVDLFIGKDNPKKSRHKEFLLNLRRNLSVTGRVLYNCHYHKDRDKEYANFVLSCQKIFSSVDEVFIYPYNRILSLR